MDAKSLIPKTEGSHVAYVYISIYVLQTYVWNIIIKHLLVKNNLGLNKIHLFMIWKGNYSVLSSSEQKLRY